MNGKENEKDVERLLRSLGIGATYRGYRYLNYAFVSVLRMKIIFWLSASFSTLRSPNISTLPAAA